MNFNPEQILKLFYKGLVRQLRLFTLDFNWNMVKAALDKKLVFFIVVLATLYLSVGIMGSVFTGTSEESILEETILDESALEGPSSSLREPAANITLGGTVIPGHVLPVGTQMVIPPWIQQQYQMSNQKQFYDNSMMNFLIHNYGVVAPSVSAGAEGSDTYYIPLSYREEGDDDDDDDDDYDDDDYDDDDYDTYMVDVTFLKQSVEPAQQKAEVLESETTEETQEPEVVEKTATAEGASSLNLKSQLQNLINK